MTNIKLLFQFLLLISLFSCKSQDLKIIINDDKNLIDTSIINMFLLEKNDTLTLNPIKQNFYHINRVLDKSILIKYKSKNYILNKIDNTTKSIVINYNPNAEDKCYIVNKIYDDAIQSSNLINVKNCSDVTNIYLYNKYDLDQNHIPAVKIRVK